MKEIYQFIKIICKDLKIKKPKAQIVKSFANKTQLAAYETRKNVLLIRTDLENMHDLFFAVAHELRHKYQIDYDILDPAKHKPNGTISTRDYNLQEEEIDANAYAFIIMISAFGVQPSFKSLDQDVIDRIKERAKEIADTKK